MKKSILFASGIALLSFAGCDDGSAKIAELQTQLDQAKQERDAASLASQEQLTNLTTTYQFQVDSLQYIIDSLTAPKGTTPSKPKPKAPTTSTTPTKTEPTKPTGNTNDSRGGTTGATGTNTNTNRGGTTNKTDSTGGNTNTKRGGTTNP